ncbi:protein kinase [Fibrobacterota bacterium]
MNYGRYRILSQIGEGGMARVFLAEDPVLGRSVAVKVLHPHLASNRSQMERFAIEARTAATLKSPHIIEIYDYGIQDNRQYFVMEYIKGSSLSSVCEAVPGMPLPSEVCASIICQASEGLLVAEKKQVVHRDLKPENLMIDHEGIVKIADFGIARPGGDSGGRTQPGTVIGTPYYMAPEQFIGLPTTTRTDIWALGVNLYFCLTGCLPFEGEEITEILNKVCTQKHESVVRKVECADSELSRLTDIMLHKDPRLRGKGARWLRDVLRKYLRKRGVYNPGEVTRKFIDDLGPLREKRRRPLQADGRSDSGAGVSLYIPSKEGGVTGTDTDSTSGGTGYRGGSDLSSLLPRKNTTAWVAGKLKDGISQVRKKLGRLVVPEGERKGLLSLAIEPDNLKLEVGQSMQLSYKISPPDAGKEIVWESSNSKVVLVRNASVFGLSPGKARVYAVPGMDPSLKAVCRVQVRSKSPEEE